VIPVSLVSLVVVWKIRPLQETAATAAADGDDDEEEEEEEE